MTRELQNAKGKEPGASPGSSSLRVERHAGKQGRNILPASRAPYVTAVTHRKKEHPSALTLGSVFTDHGGHPPHDMEVHTKLYATWRMPDPPHVSCCNDGDCYPTEARFENGQWFAKRREDGKFIFVPPHKIERHRDNPDGRNHVCMPPPSAVEYSPGTIFCFALGSGA
jgi:hypothetical protein